MNRSVLTRVAGAIVATGAAAAISLAGAGVAQAAQYNSGYLAPNGGEVCTNPQYAGFQVRGLGSASGEGAKFKLKKNGMVVANTPSRVNGYGVELRSAYGTFPGAGYYSLCAVNTGNYYTNATVQLFTDYEF